MKVSAAVDMVESRAMDGNGNLKSEAELQTMIRDAADNGMMNAMAGGLPKAVEQLMDSHFNGNATEMVTFLQEHEQEFANHDALDFVQNGAPAYIEAVRAQEAQQEAARLAAAQTTPDASAPEEPAASAAAPAATEAATPAVAASTTTGAVVGTAAAATAATAASDPAAAARAAMDANTTQQGTTDFLGMLRNMDMDQFDANGDGQVDLGELFKGIIEAFMGEEGSGQFQEMMNDQDGIFAQMFGGAGTQTIGTPLAGQAGLDTGGAPQLDPSTGEPVPTPGQQPAPGSVTPGMEPNDPTLTGPRAPT